MINRKLNDNDKKNVNVRSWLCGDASKERKIEKNRCSVKIDNYCFTYPCTIVFLLEL